MYQRWLPLLLHLVSVQVNLDELLLLRKKVSVFSPSHSILSFSALVVPSQRTMGVVDKQCGVVHVANKQLTHIHNNTQCGYYSHFSYVFLAALLEDKMKSLHEKFRSIQKSTIRCLEKCQVAIITVVSLMSTILGFDVRGAFQKKHHKDLHECKDHWELFGYLNLYWNYLSFNIFNELLQEPALKKYIIYLTRGEIDTYIQDMEIFQKYTTLILFGQVPYKLNHLPPGFQRMVTKHHWSEATVLKEVEKFRQSFLDMFGLQQCAMIMEQVTLTWSFNVLWFAILPDTVVEQLKLSKGEIKVLEDFNVFSVTFDGDRVYNNYVSIRNNFPCCACVYYVYVLLLVHSTHHFLCDKPCCSFSRLNDWFLPLPVQAHYLKSNLLHQLVCYLHISSLKGL